MTQLDSPEPQFIAGHPALDFVNTVAWRTDDARRVERVTGVEEWILWAAKAGIDAPVQGAGGLTELRGALGEVLDALVDGVGPLPPGPWQELSRAIVRARQRADVPAELPLRWRPAGLDDALALLAEELLAGPYLERIGRCQGPGCGWFYLDRTRAGNRRWCSSGDCGNRDRARRHYARSAQSSPR
ncbi:CGNR zinc finger domain-containing protein [Streptomyces sp. NPDC087440]|uniref:CGNR zinc finger domain-containing protein n=1 Tax=Streptomyces sp. NPDC087440 TaxID=3365790 RepID=UPI003801FCEC